MRSKGLRQLTLFDDSAAEKSEGSSANVVSLERVRAREDAKRRAMLDERLMAQAAHLFDSSDVGDKQ